MQVCCSEQLSLNSWAGLTYGTGLGLPLLPACPSIMLPCGLWAGPPCKALPEVAPEEVLIVCAP